MEGQHAQTLFEAAIFPAISGFVLCLGFVVMAWRRPVGRPAPWIPLDGTGRRSLARGAVRLAFAGTVTFGLIVFVYSVMLQHEPQAVSAVWGGAFLLGVTAVAWTGLTLMADRRARRRGAARARG